MDLTLSSSDSDLSTMAEAPDSGTYQRRTKVKRRFVLKNLAAEEFTLAITATFSTIGDLRQRVYTTMNIPIPLQRYAGAGRSCEPGDDGSTPISYLLPDSNEEYDPIIWLIWMRDTDFYNVHEGGIFLQSELEEKRRMFENRPTSGRQPHISFEYITLSGYRRICARMGPGMHEDPPPSDP